MMNHGSGISLSITKEFVELHRGSIRVESILGEGSCFILNLPLKKIYAVDESVNDIFQEEYAAAVSQKLQHIDKDKSTVLLAEDNLDFRFYLKDNLKQYFNILEASNGKDAWKTIVANNPDLIVSDIMMPLVSGIELTKKNKERSTYSIYTCYSPLLHTIPMSQG